MRREKPKSLNFPHPNYNNCPSFPLYLILIPLFFMIITRLNFPFYCIFSCPSDPEVVLWLSSLAQAKWSQCWHQREAPLTTQDLWEVPQQTSDGEDLQAPIWFHRAQNQVRSQADTRQVKSSHSAYHFSDMYLYLNVCFAAKNYIAI